ncbi:response regulator, partial [Kineosporia mesophila]|uniref:response regulator n=1 Tax=Kineosporia mesophila TaxID=566012 RepID=UPI001E4FAF3E
MDSQDRPILLVDDDASDIELTRWAFQNSGFTTDMAIARDGLEALDLLLPSDGRPPLEPAMVLMDVDMPRMGGVETVRRIRAEPSTKLLPVIMLTSSLADRDIVDSSNVGANGYVQKPLDIEDLLKIASAVGAFWIDLNRTHGTPGRPSTSPPVPGG